MPSGLSFSGKVLCCRVLFSSLIVVFLLGFVFHMKNEQTVLVDYIFSEGSFKVSWIVLISMLTGSLLAALTILPACLKMPPNMADEKEAQNVFK